MAFETLIGVRQLHGLLSAGQNVLLLDCEFDLAGPDKGPALFAESHLPGARHAHLDNDLAGPPGGDGGRHPLPAPVALGAWLRTQGLCRGQQVVVYDSSGAMWAARAWWLLRWLGHREVAVLDGGKGAWVAAGMPLESGMAHPVSTGNFEVQPSLVATPVDIAEVAANIESPVLQILDARDPARYCGTPNPIDPVAGHIPGARNRFFRDNLDRDGQFRPASELAREFEALLGGKPAVLNCGSGVTACHNALAMEIAGIGGARLFPASWSGWINDPARPVATGND